VYIEAQIQAASDCAVTVIDFSRVGMMDFSCADEIVAKLVMQHENGTPTFVFSGLSESHLEAIDVVLERHGMSLVSHEADSNSYIAVTH
jgi:anti-anti-sigma regulatory factor